MSYQGSCHCGRIAYTVEGDIDHVIECNCSICSKRGSLLWFVPRTKFKLHTPQADVSTYLFNKRRIHHHHCAVCGCAPYSEANDPKANRVTAINVRCLEGVDLAALKRVSYDGRSL